MNLLVALCCRKKCKDYVEDFLPRHLGIIQSLPQESFIILYYYFCLLFVKFMFLFVNG